MPSESESTSTPFATTALDIALGLFTAFAAATLWIICFTAREAIGRPPRRPQPQADPCAVTAT